MSALLYVTLHFTTALSRVTLQQERVTLQPQNGVTLQHERVTLQLCV